ncbi:hypothetical protein [Phenylobacterium soli]|uniref:hypothetical protein n=1 Tax=Phenylobacterium soli TaxID=2170551 RepID=UPI001057DA81|nr:hypothetical protein [Phenylobacterium soli]
MPKHKEDWFREFDEQGEAEVRKRFNLGHMRGLEETFARQWLAQRDTENSEASHSEQMDLSRRAAKAAEDAASAARSANAQARTANKIAMAALVAAIVAIIVSALKP